MAEKNGKDKQDLRPSSPDISSDEGLDVASRSLSEALRISFIILKVIMIILVIAFLASGFRTVGSDERALVLRFGRIRGIGEGRLLKPGAHWVFPYPIDEIIKIPVEKKVNQAVNTFWYFQSESELLSEGKDRTRIPEKLDPVKDGYCLTRSEKGRAELIGFATSDYHIIHSKWQLIYQIENPELFFKNVYVKDVKPGQVYFDVVTKSIKPLLQMLLEDAVVTAMVNYTVDDVMFERVGRVTEHVKRLIQSKLDEVGAGIKVVSVQLTDKIWPRQVNEAFQAAIKASQESEREISEARTYAENTLNQAGGPVARQLFAALGDDGISSEEKELLWSQVAGEAGQRIAEARAYRTRIVETARANAEYLHKILPEYSKRPQLVLQRIYLDTVEEVLNNTDEKMVIQPAQGTKGKEVRILISRNPELKPKSGKGQRTSEK